MLIHDGPTRINRHIVGTIWLSATFQSCDADRPTSSTSDKLKGNPMSWDQIESKWAEMVVRVQPFAAKRSELVAKPPEPPKPEPSKGPVA